jgi:hypothetical protein
MIEYILTEINLFDLLKVNQSNHRGTTNVINSHPKKIESELNENYPHL